MADPNRFETIAQNARDMVEQQGLAPDAIDPAIVMLATNNPKQVTAAAWDYYFAEGDSRHVKAARERHPEHPEIFERIYANKLHLLDATFNEEDLKLARTVDPTAAELRIPARRRGRIRMFVSGVAVGSAVLLGLSYMQARSHDDAIAAGAERPEGSPDRIHPTFALVADPSIWGEDQGPDTPVIGPILARIPGVPDFEPIPVEVTHVETKTIETKETSVESRYEAGEVQNPVAPNLELVGSEYAQGRAAAKEFFSKLPAGSKLTQLSVLGTVSDELNCQVGVQNPEQQALADARAAAAARAFFDESLIADVALPEGVNSAEKILQSGKEIVLAPEDIQKLQELLQNRDLCSEITSFNTATMPDSELKAFLNEKLGAKRGAQFNGKANYEVETTKPTPVIKETEHTLPLSIQGEFFFFGYAGVVIMYSGMFGLSRQRPRAVRKEAQKRAREAGLEI